MSGKKRILLVDDDKDFIESTKQVLESSGYEVLTANSGAEGLEKAKSQYPNLMILDVMMTSDTEGFEVSRKIEESQDLKGIPIILLTGIKKAMSLPFSFEPDEDWLPVKAVLDKPVKPEKLLAEVEKHIKK